VRPTDRVVVAGANIGFEALLVASQLSGPGSVCAAFEPVRENFALLRENVRLSGLGAAMRLFSVALGRADGTTEMAVAGSRSSSVLPVAEARGEHVAVRSLDSLFREGVLETACAIIADIEGSELDMLLGGEQFIAASPLRFMMLELNRAVEQVRPGTVSSVIRLLHESGLVCFGIDDDYRGFRPPTPATGCLRRIERPETPFVLPYQWFNVLALPRDEVPAVEALGAIAADAT
jgi:FkbM family methyltransferase